MFYSDAILSRRGPLGKVWLAAHMERKLSKSQTLQTDIEQSVDAIMGQDIEVMALRLSGQLLLGVVRIYSRKAKYLLDDCNDALLKIKMAFRPGIVDLTEDQLNVNKTAITLQTNNIDLDLLLPDVNWDMDFEERPVREQGHHQALIEDITLPSANNFDQFGGVDPFDIGPSDGIGSHDFGELDLGIDWNGDPIPSDAMSVDGSVGVGRDAVSVHESFDMPHLNGVGKKNIDIDMQSVRSQSRALSEAPFMPPLEDDFPDFGGMDLGDLGITFDKPLEEPEADKDPSSRASSPLTEIPETPVMANEQALLDAEPVPKPKKVKEKKQIIDAVTELNEGTGRRDRLADALPLKDVSNIITEQQFLPRSTLTMRLMEIQSDPLAHFLPTTTKDNQTFFCAAPPGLGGDLMDLFLRPVDAAATKRRHVSPAENGHKRMRIEEDEIEQVRRATSVAQSPAPFKFDEPAGSGDLDFGEQPAPFDDDYQLDITNGVENIGLEGARSRSVSLMPSNRSRHSTPGAGSIWGEGEESYADLSCPIAVFDSRHPGQSQLTQEEQQDVPELQEQEEGSEEKGYSKNTVKALSLVRKELQPEEDGEPVTMSFKNMATKASRRAAASFFFELLVLGTRDCVKLEQKGPFKDITVQGKDKLWQQSQRHGSVAPSDAGLEMSMEV